MLTTSAFPESSEKFLENAYIVAPLRIAPQCSLLTGLGRYILFVHLTEERAVDLV